MNCLGDKMIDLEIQIEDFFFVHLFFILTKVNVIESVQLLSQIDSLQEFDADNTPMTLNKLNKK